MMLICAPKTNGFLLKHCLFLENAAAAASPNIDVQGTDLLQNGSKFGFRSRILFPRQDEKEIEKHFLLPLGPLHVSTRCHNVASTYSQAR